MRLVSFPSLTRQIIHKEGCRHGITTAGLCSLVERWETVVHSHVTSLQMMGDLERRPRVLSQGRKRNRMLNQGVDTTYKTIK